MKRDFKIVLKTRVSSRSVVNFGPLFESGILPCDRDGGLARRAFGLMVPGAAFASWPVGPRFDSRWRRLFLKKICRKKWGFSVLHFFCFLAKWKIVKKKVKIFLKNQKTVKTPSKTIKNHSPSGKNNTKTIKSNKKQTNNLKNKKTVKTK